MKRVCVFREDADRCVKVYMEASDVSNMAIDKEVAQKYPNCGAVIDLFDYGTIDVSITHKDFDPSTLKAITWLVDNGFEGTLTKYNTSGAEFRVTKNGVSDTLTLTGAVLNPKKVNILDYMKQFEKSFTMLETLTGLRKKCDTLIGDRCEGNKGC